MQSVYIEQLFTFVDWHTDEYSLAFWLIALFIYKIPWSAEFLVLAVDPALTVAFSFCKNSENAIVIGRDVILNFLNEGKNLKVSCAIKSQPRFLTFFFSILDIFNYKSNSSDWIFLPFHDFFGHTNLTPEHYIKPYIDIFVDAFFDGLTLFFCDPSLVKDIIFMYNPKFPDTIFGIECQGLGDSVEEVFEKIKKIRLDALNEGAPDLSGGSVCPMPGLGADAPGLGADAPGLGADAPADAPASPADAPGLGADAPADAPASPADAPADAYPPFPEKSEFVKCLEAFLQALESAIRNTPISK